MMDHSRHKLTDNDLGHLGMCLDLAREALEAGDEPFGSILVSSDDEVMAQARNRVNELNVLAHPEIELAQWAAENLSLSERRATTMYTSGEHCPMCAAAHGWVGVGTLVYLSSGRQLAQWLSQPSPINFIPVEQVVKTISVRGPAGGELLQNIKNLQLTYHHARMA